MTGVLASCLAFGVAWVVGYFLVGALWPLRPRALAARLFHLAAALGLGTGVVAVLDLLWIVAFGKASLGVVVVELALVVALALVYRRTRPALPTTGAPPPGFGWVSGVTCLVVSALALGIVGTLLLRIRDGDWDAIVIWNVHAKFFNAPSKGGWKAVFDPVMLATHPDYPPLVPAAVARGWMYAGHSLRLVPVILAGSFAAASLALVAGAVASARSAGLGALACTMVASSPIFLGTAASQYADPPLAFYFLLTVALFHRADADRDDDRPAGLYVLAGLAAGFAALTKNEGSLFLVALGAGRALHLLLAAERRRQLRSLGWLCLGLAPPLAVLLLYKSFAPPNYLVAAQDHHAWGKVLTRPRVQLIVAELIRELEKPHDLFTTNLQRTPTWHWHLFVSSAFLLLFGLDRRRLARRLSQVGLGLVVLGVVAILGSARWSTGVRAFAWPAALAVVLLVVGFGFDLRRLRQPAFVAAVATVLVVNLGYFCAYLLTPLDLRWQLVNSLERLLLHTLPLTIFLAFMAVASGAEERARRSLGETDIAATAASTRSDAS